MNMRYNKEIVVDIVQQEDDVFDIQLFFWIKKQWRGEYFSGFETEEQAKVFFFDFIEKGIYIRFREHQEQLY